MLRLLLVDDERIARESLRKRIPWRELGIGAIQTAKNGAEALVLANEVKPDIVITDVRMPKMDGIEFAGKIRQLYPDCRIVFLSGYADKEYLKSAIRVRAVDYIEKPIDITEFVAGMRRVIATFQEDSPAPAVVGPRRKTLWGEILNGKLDDDVTNSLDLDEKIAVVVQYVKEKYSDNQLSLHMIADHVNLSPTYLCIYFKKVTNIKLNEYITRIRIENSKMLLKNSKDKLAQIASEVGYADANYFSTLFRKYVGCTPSQFRMKGSHDR